MRQIWNRPLLSTLVIGLTLATPGFAPTAQAERALHSPVDIPFELEGSNIVVEVELTPGHSLPFVFDSGLSSGNVISTEMAKALGLKANTELAVQDANGDRSSSKLTAIPTISVGGAKLTKQPFAITPIPDEVTQRPGKPALAGFLGAPLMKDAVLCIDYSHHTLHRWNPHDFDSTRFSSVPMSLTHELPTIGVTIDGRRATMIVDSGNNGAVTVYPYFAEKNDFRKRYPRLVPRGGFSGGSSSFDALSGEADTVEIGQDLGFRHVPLWVIPQGMDPAWGIDGMVGFQILARLDPCLDRAGKRFLFRLDNSLPSASATPATQPD